MWCILRKQDSYATKGSITACYFLVHCSSFYLGPDTVPTVFPDPVPDPRGPTERIDGPLASVKRVDGFTKGRA
jgi:hypothetical protein